ncbi:MAG: hypothetical protein P8X63_00295 [Desulfuromonadaceae bacterium]
MRPIAGVWKRVVLILLAVGVAISAPLATRASEVAVFPLLDISRGPNGITLPVTRYLTERLSETGTEFSRPDMVISFMAHNRIRVAGELETFHLKQVEEDLGVAFVLLGAVVQDKEKPTPSFGVTLNLIRTYDGLTVWSYVGAFSATELLRPLGIGDITSVAELQTLIGDELVKRWPADAVKQEIRDSASIDSILLTPKFVRPGAEVHCTVRLRNRWTVGRTPKVFFKVNEQLHAGSWSEASGGYEATWVAGEQDGRYPVSLLLEWPLYGRTETVPLGSFVVDGVPPLVALELKGERMAGETKVFRGEVTVMPSLIVRKPIARWRITFKTLNDVVVATEEHAGNIPNRVVWAGHNVWEGQEVEGEYRAFFEVWDDAGNTASASETFELKSIPAEVVVEAAKKGEEVVVELQRDSKVPLAYWRLEMWSEEGRLLKQAEGEELPEQLSFELPEVAPDRKIGGILITEDVLGNKGRKNITDFFPPAGQNKAPAEEEQKSATETWVDEF